MTPLSEDIIEFFLVCAACVGGLYCLALIVWGSISFGNWLIQVTG